MRILTAVVSYSVGLFFMIGSDSQKYFVLKTKRGLIVDGFFAFTRNPNYLGEILIYLSFGIVAKSYASYTILITIWIVYFGLRMFLKDQSLRKYPNFEEYSQKSYILFPKVFNKESMNILFYGALTLIVYLIYNLNV